MCFPCLLYKVKYISAFANFSAFPKFFDIETSWIHYKIIINRVRLKKSMYLHKLLRHIKIAITRAKSCYFWKFQFHSVRTRDNTSSVDRDGFVHSLVRKFSTGWTNCLFCIHICICVCVCAYSDIMYVYVSGSLKAYPAVGQMEKSCWNTCRKSRTRFLYVSSWFVCIPFGC